jgi:Zn-finger protein
LYLPIRNKRGSPLWAIACLAFACLSLALSSPALAGEHHTGGSLICNDCHVTHNSQQHAMTSGGTMVSLGTNGPYASLLRNDVNDLCLSCHDGQSFAPDVFGANGGVARNRTAGALNSAAGHKPNDTGYDDVDGHSLWSTATAPGGTWANTADGLECTDCHAQHGQTATQYRNLKSSTTATDKYYGKTLTYASIRPRPMRRRTWTSMSRAPARAPMPRGASRVTPRSTRRAGERSWAGRAAATPITPSRGSGIRRPT